MAITNAEMAAAWGDLLGLTPEKITELAGLLDQWALGGARLATLARLTTDVSTFNDAAIRMVHDWYGGAADGGPNGDGLYPLMNSDAEVFLLPSPAKIMAGVSGLDPKGELASTGDLPETGAQGDLWVIGGAAWVWSVSAGAFVNMGPFRGPQGHAGVISGATISMLAPGAAPTVTLGGTPSDRTVTFGFPAAADGVTPDVSFEVVMVAHGLAATVVQSGTAEAPHLIFNIPSPLPGVDGKNIEIQKSATHVQWRRVGDVAWVDLIALTDLMVKGDKGDAFQFDAKPATLAGRAAYDAEAEGFTVLVMDTGMVFARVSATPGVWSDGFPFGQTQNAILEALSALNATEGVLVQTGPTTFAKRAIGGASDDDLLSRSAADGRYRLKGEAVALADVTGLAAALDDKANAAAMLALLAQKADKADTYTKGQVDAVTTRATAAQVRAGKASGVLIEPDEAAAAMAFTALTDAATVAIDLDTGPNFTLTTTAGVGVGRTIGLPTNGNPGQFYTLQITADAIGRTVAWNTAFKWPGGTAQAIASAAANAITLVSFRMVGASVFQVVGFVKDIR